MSVHVDALLYGWNNNLDYALRLFKDVPAEKMCHQPSAGMTHPAWVLCHLGVYHPVIAAVLRQQAFADPKDHEYGFQSEAVNDPGKYPAKDALVDAFARSHAEVTGALQAVDPALFEQQPPLPRWQGKIKNIGVLVTDLMLVHESTHLGQVSAWRRVQGMGRV